MTELLQQTPPVVPPVPLTTPETPPVVAGTSPTDKTGETPPAETKSLLNQDDKKPEAPAGAPDKYAAFTAPEGFEFDEKMMGEAQTLFKEAGLPQATAQKLVDFYGKNIMEAIDAPVKHWRETNDAWVKEITADPEIGPKLDAVKTTVSRAIDSILGPTLGVDFKKAMDLTGAGNNPAFIRGFYKFAQLLSEGGHVKGNSPAPGGQGNAARPPTAAAAMYPNLPSAQG